MRTRRRGKPTSRKAPMTRLNPSLELPTKSQAPTAEAGTAPAMKRTATARSTSLRLHHTRLMLPRSMVTVRTGTAALTPITQARMGRRMMPAPKPATPATTEATTAAPTRTSSRRGSGSLFLLSRAIILRMSRWIAVAGAFVASLDSMVNVAFPAMTVTFAAAPEDMRWVIVSYVGTYALMSVVAGALADVLRHGRVFRAGLAVSALGFLGVGQAPSLSWVIVGRIVQGLGGGMIYGTAPGMVTLAAPPEARGRALGFFNAAVAVAFATGPLLAGLMIQVLGWRWVFHVRGPLAVRVLGWAVRGRGPTASGATRRLVQRRELFRLAVLHAGALSFIANAGIFAVWLLAPFYLVERRELDAVAAGAMFMLTPLGTALAAPLAGRCADRLGPRFPIIAGLGLETLGLLVMSRADGHTPLAVVAGALLAAGFGLGAFQVPNMTWIMTAFSSGQQGAAGGLAFLARTLGVMTGVLILSAVFAARREAVGFDTAFGNAFLVAAVMVAAAAVAALRAPRGRDGQA